MSLLASLVASACGAGATSTPDQPGVTAAASATLPSVIPESASADAAGTDDIWLEQPFGPDGQLAVLFYDEGGQACVRYLVDVEGAQPSSACGNPESAALAAVQGQQADSTGQMYTIVVGRVFKPATRVVAVEMEDGESFSVNVDGGGIILILEGARRAVRAVPIDEFGNLTGEIFRF